MNRGYRHTGNGGPILISSKRSEWVSRKSSTFLRVLLLLIAYCFFSCNSHVYTFDGAEGGQYVEDMRAAYPAPPPPYILPPKEPHRDKYGRMLKRLKGT